MDTQTKIKFKDLRSLYGYVGEYKRYAILTNVFVILEVILEVMIPLIMAQIINVGVNTELTEFIFHLELGALKVPIFTSPGRIEFIATCGSLIGIMALLALMFGVLSGITASKAATGFSANMRSAVYDKVQSFSFLNLDRFNTASLVTRLTTDMNNLQLAYQMSIRMLCRAPIMLLLALTMSISINPKLSIIFAAAIPLLIIGLLLTAKIVFPRYNKMLFQYDKMNEVTQENMTGVRAIKAFVREKNEIKRFKKVSDKVRQLEFSAVKIMAIIMPFMQIVIYTCIICIVWFGGNQIVTGDMELGYFSAFISYVMQILISLMLVAIVFVTMVLSRASACRIVEVLNEEIDIVEKDDCVDTEPTDGSIEFSNVDFSYSKNVNVLNLENINIKIESGETVGIIGATGSAKSTLIQLIPRLYDVYSGSIKVGGVDVRDYSLDALRSSIGMVMQKNVLFSGTIKENLLWGNMDASDEDIIHAAKSAQAHDFITSFEKGYETYLGQGGVNVSGGQKQRLCIARALVKKPKIMILDDSTSAVDTATDRAIQNAFKEEFKDTTVILIAQRINSVQDADRIIVLYDGKINDIGTHQQLLESNEIYKDIFESQQKGIADE